MFSIALFLVSRHGGAALPVIIPSRWVTLGAMRPNVGSRRRAWHRRGDISNKAADQWVPRGLGASGQGIRL